MDYLQKSILKTIAYWDAFDWPLTPFEIWRYLVNPRRLGMHANDRYSLAEINAALDSKELGGYLSHMSGFFCLKDRGETIVPGRLSRELDADQKWKRMLRRARWFRLIPYVRLVLVSGSLASGNTRDASDWDLLIVTKANRIWTCRAVFTFIADLLHWRRKSDTDTKDKFCLNHFITEHSLLINLPSLYNAQMYAHLVPVFGDFSLYRSFQERNGWIRSYLAHYPMAFIPHKKSLRSSRLLGGFASAVERLLDTSAGDAFERKLGDFQTKKIAANPKTGAPGGRISYSSDALEFHPDSKEKVILSRLNDRFSTLGFPELADEQDSGLTP